MNKFQRQLIIGWVFEKITRIRGNVYCEYHHHKQVIWNEQFAGLRQQIIILKLHCNGGYYDQEGFQKKIGMLVELDEKFSDNYTVTHIGEYNMNNMKVGRWDICWVEGQQIGGGSYDQEGNQKKIGKWVELFEGFWKRSQVTYNGEYNQKGQNVGTWVEMDILENKIRGEKKFDR